MNPGVKRWFAENVNLKGKTLEVGSRVTNCGGYVRRFDHGIDIKEGEHVDEILSVHDLVKKYGPDSWDNVVCFETLEHIEDWRSSYRNIWEAAKNTVVITVPTLGKGYHAHPDDYWRWDLLLFSAMFRNCTVHSLEQTWSNGIGIWVQKDGEIDLSIEPQVVMQDWERQQRRAQKK